MLTQIQLLKKYNLRVRGQLGQHLLIDPNLQRKIVDLLELRPGDPVLEIGPGLGALTGALLEQGADVTAVEKDAGFVKVLEEEFEENKNLKIVHEDILKYDTSLRAKRSNQHGKFKVIGNLPYYISTPILFYLIDQSELIEKAVLMLQKEVAARFLASPGTKDYGRLTLAVRYAAEVSHAFNVSSKCFIPPPEVDSTVIVLTFHPKSQRLKPQEEEFLFEVVRIAFSQRRKMLAHLLSHEPKLKTDKAKVLQIFEEIGISPKVRGEELLLKDYMMLAEKLKNG